MSTIAPAAPRTRRSPDEQIAALQARIDAIRERQEHRTARGSPAVRHACAVVRAIDRAWHGSADLALSMALADARRTLVGCLAQRGVRIQATAESRRGPRAPTRFGVLTEKLHEYVIAHPGVNPQRVRSELDVDAATLRRAVNGLIRGGKVRREGAAGRTAYVPV